MQNYHFYLYQNLKVIQTLSYSIRWNVKEQKKKKRGNRKSLLFNLSQSLGLSFLLDKRVFEDSCARKVSNLVEWSSSSFCTRALAMISSAALEVTSD